MEKKWWHNKVGYEIYPKSFFDTDGDGIGDIKGIIEKLDYLEELGVDIIWVSPCYCSPMADQGYDISDYYNIDPKFGSIKDMDVLIAEAKKRNMYIILDLVVNHCSDEHEWFQRALEDPDGKYGKYFYIEEMKDGKVPCNWRGYFGGSVWEPIPGTNKCYLHLFHKKQPDLNWENIEVRKEIYKMINWWLNKGIAGFRIDAIINIKKAAFRDYPADRDDGMVRVTRMIEDAVDIGVFLNELAENTFRKYDAFTVGEVFNEREEDIPKFIGENGYFSTMFDFNATMFGSNSKGWYAQTPVTMEAYKNCCFETQGKLQKDGFYSNILENHDQPRGISYFLPKEDCCEKSKKALALAMFFLRGIPFLYQGQEIGMEDLPVPQSIEDVDDISAKAEYQVALDAGYSEKEALKIMSLFNRDNARSPMQWNAGDMAGFTTGRPWLKVNSNYRNINVEDELRDEGSLLSFYKELIKIRKHPLYEDTIVYGELIPYRQEEKNLMAFYRKSDTQSLLILINFQREERTEMIPKQAKVILSNFSDSNCTEKTVLLRGYEAMVLELDNSTDL